MIFNSQLIGQNFKINQAEMYFNSYRYAEATPIYEELILEDNLDINQYDSIYRHATISADKCHNFVFENDVFTRLSLSSKYTFDDAYSYFKLSMFLGFYEKAKEILKSQIVINSSDERIKIMTNYKGGAVWSEFNSDTSRYEISKSSFNSGKGDFNPVYHPNGIVFSSGRGVSLKKSTLDNSSYLNLYQFSILDGNINPLKFLNNAKHDGTAFYDSINTCWYYSKNLEDTKFSKFIKTGIFIYDEKTKIETVFPFNNSAYFLAQPSLSEDGQTLWFSSDKPGGFGKSDIWYSKKTDTGWSEPVNAGKKVNTIENEMFPYSKQSFLYFSSNGHVGLGGLDLYKVKMVNDSFETITNLGANLNSNADDFSIVFSKSGKKGYFSSNRGEFIDNIYSFIIRDLDFFFIGNVVSDLSKDEMQSISIYIKKDDAVIDTLYTDSLGKFEFKGDENSTYTFEINENEYLPLTEDYSTIAKTKSDTTVKAFNLISKPIYVDKIQNNDGEVVTSVELKKDIVISNIKINQLSYDFNKSTLKPEAKIELDKIVAFLKENPTAKIEFSSHTDARGSTEQNMILSKKRTESSVAYLVSKGVNKNKIVSKWYGESMLLNKCKDGVPCTEEEHTVNRRTEIKVLSR